MLLLFACAPEAPPAETRCDGRDDDQDGVVDEGLARTWYADLDGDGWGTSATALTTCDAPDGYAAQAGDCDDGDPAAHPGATETCATPADEDCDGVADPEGAEGCVDGWPDADGDGLGEGEPVCACVVSGVAVGGDCDGADVDRGVDCTEGVAEPLTGARIALDDADAYWSLLGAAEVEDGQLLAMASTDEHFLLATVPPEATTLSAVTAALYDAPTWSRPVLGDLDGDGLTDLLAPTGTIEAGDPWTLFTPTLGVYAGPLDAPVGTDVTLDGVRATEPQESLFVADLDGDAVAEAWYVLGSGVAAGQVGAWRVGAAMDVLVEPDAAVAGVHTRVRALGDVDGDGFTDLGSYAEGDAPTLAAHMGPLTTLPSPEGATALLDVPVLDDVVPLGDVDGDGRDDVGLREARIWVLTTLATGALAEVAHARIGPENDADGESALFVGAGDVGADGTRDLLVSDTFWPWNAGAGNMRGALYVFAALPAGVVDARAADRRVYAEEYALFGAFPTVLADGRVAVGAPLDSDDQGVGAVWIVE